MVVEDRGCPKALAREIVRATRDAEKGRVRQRSEQWSPRSKLICVIGDYECAIGEDSVVMNWQVFRFVELEYGREEMIAEN